MTRGQAGYPGPQSPSTQSSSSRPRGADPLSTQASQRGSEENKGQVEIPQQETEEIDVLVRA